MEKPQENKILHIRFLPPAFPAVS